MKPFLLAAALIALAPAAEQVPPASADYLRAHEKFLASDLLEGRGTPSRGLDIAAQYIASEFEKYGIKPGVGDSYFQETTYTSRRQGVEGKVRNVIGVLPGSDPKLKDTYVLVTAHYDHLGMRKKENPEPGEDLIFNGANDDGSGTAGVMECARILSQMKTKPKRSIVFMCFWGEEEGLRGSAYYGKNPVFPLAATTAQINLEQIGRSDSDEGVKKAGFNITGATFTDLPQMIAKAAATVGVKYIEDPQHSDAYFMASDNGALALVGVPAHTISVAYGYPDYHRVGDHWDKLDYPNFALVVRAAATAAYAVADSTTEPKWNAANPKAKRYAEARAKGGG